MKIIDKYLIYFKNELVIYYKKNLKCLLKL